MYQRLAVPMLSQTFLRVNTSTRIKSLHHPILQSTTPKWYTIFESPLQSSKGAERSCHKAIDMKERISFSKDLVAENKHQQNIASHTNAELLKSGLYADLRIYCGGQEYHLHRSIVCLRSKFLANASDGRFKLHLCLSYSKRKVDYYSF